MQPSNSLLRSGVHFRILVIKSKISWQKKIKSQSVSLILALTKVNSWACRQLTKKVSFVEVGFLTIRDGKIVEQWSINDTMGLMQQIGAIPAASPMSTADTTHT